ncbi:MAG: HAD family hydrolase [Planctomycetes bacterium]|nr:HAD family hydrolase [Planctomycetota bacterium]
MLTGINCLLFDMDGTLTMPMLDFDAIKVEMDVPVGISILEYLETVEDADKRSRLWAILDKHELHAATNSTPNHGYPKLMEFLNGRRYKIAVLTRNSRKNAMITLDLIGFTPEVLISREDSPYKPKPDAVLKALNALDAMPDETLMIGDFKYDIIAGQKAGCFTCFITNNREEYDCDNADFIIENLADLRDLLKNV